MSISIAGALVPQAAVSIGLTSGVGIVGGYIGGSFANKNLNPLKWDWENPNTYAGIFDGFTAGSGIVKGIGSMNSFVKTFKNVNMQKYFVKGSISAAVGLGFYSAANANGGNIAFWEWEWNERQMAVTFGEIFSGFSSVIALSSTVGGVKSLHTSEYVATTIIGRFEIIEKLQKVIRKLPGPVAETISGIISGLAAAGKSDDIGSTFDLENYELEKLSTYESFIDGYFKGRKGLTDSAQIHDATCEVSKQEEILEKFGREKRSLEWRITLFIDPEMIEHNVIPEVTTSIVPMAQNDNIIGSGDEEAFENKNLTQAIYITPYQTSTNKPIANITPYENLRYNSSFNILEMGDNWLQQTDTIGNLTLLNLLVEKFFSSKKSSKPGCNKMMKSDVEYQLMTSEVVNEFIEKFMVNAELCGIFDYIVNDILENQIDFSSLNRKIEKEIRRKDFKNVSKLMMENVFLKNLKLIRKNKTDKDIEKLHNLMSKECKSLEQKLLSFEEASMKK